MGSMSAHAKLKVGQAVIFKGAPATVRWIGPKRVDEKTGEKYRSLVLDTHVGRKRVPSDHPELVVVAY